MSFRSTLKALKPLIDATLQKTTGDENEKQRLESLFENNESATKLYNDLSEYVDSSLPEPIRQLKRKLTEVKTEFETGTAQSYISLKFNIEGEQITILTKGWDDFNMEFAFCPSREGDDCFRVLGLIKTSNFGKCSNRFFKVAPHHLRELQWTSEHLPKPTKLLGEKYYSVDKMIATIKKHAK